MTSFFREVLEKSQLSVWFAFPANLKLLHDWSSQQLKRIGPTFRFRQPCLYCEVKPEVVSVFRCRATFCHNNRSDFDATRQNFTSFSRWSELCLFLWLGLIDGLRMVKVSFNSALGRKEIKDAEILLPEEQNVSRKWPSDAVRKSSLLRHAP